MICYPATLIVTFFFHTTKRREIKRSYYDIVEMTTAKKRKRRKTRYSENEFPMTSNELSATSVESGSPWLQRFITNVTMLPTSFISEITEGQDRDESDSSDESYVTAAEERSPFSFSSKVAKKLRKLQKPLKGLLKKGSGKLFNEDQFDYGSYISDGYDRPVPPSVSPYPSSR